MSFFVTVVPKRTKLQLRWPVNTVDRNTRDRIDIKLSLAIADTMVLPMVLCRQLDRLNAGKHLNRLSRVFYMRIRRTVTVVL